MVCLSKVAGCEAELARRNIICAARDHRVTSADDVVGAPADGRVLSVRLDRVAAAAANAGKWRRALDAIEIAPANSSIAGTVSNRILSASRHGCRVRAASVRGTAGNGRERIGGQITAAAANRRVIRSRSNYIPVPPAMVEPTVLNWTIF